MITTDFECSNCGRHRGLAVIIPHKYKNPSEYADNMVKEGWRSLGGVIYCPKCVRTWVDRNGKDDHRLDNAAETKEWILNHALEQMAHDLEALKGKNYED